MEILGVCLMVYGAFTGNLLLLVVGLILLNSFSAIRQGLSLQKILSGLFVEIGTQNKIEKNIRIALIIFLGTGFIALVIDALVNGIQIVNLQ